MKHYLELATLSGNSLIHQCKGNFDWIPSRGVESLLNNYLTYIVSGLTFKDDLELWQGLAVAFSAVMRLAAPDGNRNNTRFSQGVRKLYRIKYTNSNAWWIVYKQRPTMTVPIPEWLECLPAYRQRNQNIAGGSMYRGPWWKSLLLSC